MKDLNILISNTTIPTIDKIIKAKTLVENAAFSLPVPLLIGESVLQKREVLTEKYNTLLTKQNMDKMLSKLSIKAVENYAL